MNYSEISRFFQSFAGWHFIVGFSGGADSTAALLATVKCASIWQIPVEAVHCEHGLRGAESAADATWCRDFCTARQIPFHCENLDVPGNRLPGENVENAARRLRLACWQKRIAGQPHTAIILGHHRDDRRENLLLRLARGSNSTGLTGMRRVTEINGVTLLRPLLKTSRREIENFLRHHGIENWRCDATNADPAMQRNFLRHHLIPAWQDAFPFAAAGIDRALDALEDDARYLETLAADALDSLPEPWRIADWRALPPPVRNRAVSMALHRKLPMAPLFSGSWFRRFGDMLTGETPEPRLLAVAGDHLLVFRKAHFTLETRQPPVCRNWCWRRDTDPEFGCRFTEPPEHWGETGTDRAFFDADLLPPELRIESGRDGDKMTVFGGRTVKWKKLRTDRGIPRRAARPLLRLTDGTVIWSPGIRHSAWAPVTARTTACVEFYLRQPLSHGGTIWQPPNN